LERRTNGSAAKARTSERLGYGKALRQKEQHLASTSSDDSQDLEVHALLLRAAELLHRYGTPSFRLEGVMTKVADSLNVPSVFLYTPTALVVALGSGSRERTYVRRIDVGDVDISKLLDLDIILEDLEAGRVTIKQASSQLESVASAPGRFSGFTSMLAAAVACGISFFIDASKSDQESWPQA